MKKILLLLSACVVLSSCAIQKYSQKTYLADYREYTADGFTITPSSSGFTYESVGDLSIKFTIGVKDGYINKEAKWKEENVFKSYFTKLSV